MKRPIKDSHRPDFKCRNEMIERTFQNVPEDDVDKADQHEYLVALGWGRGTTWQDLLRSKRVLIISEAGAGKTYECQAQSRLLRDRGEPAFFVELASLASQPLRDLLDNDDAAQLDAWRVSQSDMATFFLDSIDELTLSVGSFRQALKNLKNAVDGKLGQTRIVITTRPIPIDEKLVREMLPVPDLPSPLEGSQEESFANHAMRRGLGKPSRPDSDEVSAWRRVALIPLSQAQIGEFARLQGVGNSDQLLAELKRRDALPFARRPQDLIEICAGWKVQNRIRSHREQVCENVRVKLLPRDDRPEPAELSAEKALEGASRLALALLVTRRTAIRHNAAADVAPQEAALEPSIILADWKPDERKALLERPLFTFASYGRVRFHHRSVTEYLAAQRLQELCRRRMPLRALKRLLFAETRGRTIVRPSMRPVAGWLALNERGVFELLRDNEPAVLLDEGDPESLTHEQRIETLRAYVQRHGAGGRRGLNIPPIQIHRFAAPDLAAEIRRLWEGGVENPEVREILLDIMAEGRIGECADIAHDVAWDAKASTGERLSGLDALIAVEDPRLGAIAQAIAAKDSRWPELTRSATVRMFPRHLSVDQLCQLLAWINPQKNTFGDLNWQLARLIEKLVVDTSTLEALRDGLVGLVSDGLQWQKERSHIVNARPHLSSPLAAICLRGLAMNRSDAWLHASVLALRIPDREHGSDEARTALKEQLMNLSADDNARLFWVADAFNRSLHAEADPWQRLVWLLFHYGAVELRPDRDGPWVTRALGDTSRAPADRALLLQAAMHLGPSRETWSEHLTGLKSLVADQPDLLAMIDQRLKQPQRSKEQRALERECAQQKLQDQRREAKNRASWIQFWREVAHHPDRAFTPGRSRRTAYNLWRVMSKKGDYSQQSGWNRRLIEHHFDRATADRLRSTLMGLWRQDRPTLVSERQESERNTYPLNWLLGLAGLYAEAEDPEWATQLNHDEALLAARYAALELNELPAWMEGLIASHPNAVDAILGEELSWELRQPAGQHGHSMLLQDIHHGPTAVSAVFLPRLLDWLDTSGDLVDAGDNSTAMAERARQVIGALLEHGNPNIRARLLALAQQRLGNDLPEELAFVWLPALMRLDAVVGVDALEDRLRTVEPAERSLAVTWFGTLFHDRRGEINPHDSFFTPDLLLRLLRLAYRHVRPEDDARHEDAYSPDARDNAEVGRRDLWKALLGAKGEDGWRAKQELAGDPLFADLRDHILAVADEHWAQEIGSIILDEKQAAALDRSYEAPVTTNEAMFALMKDRLADLEDLLRSDASPREAWSAITQERVMRREIARELSHAANGLYSVDQESVTGEEKESDIRLRSGASDHEAVIELKLAERWSARDLRGAIGSQLVEKYLVTENRSSGCLLITLAKDRTWEHPDTGARIGPSELETLLCEEAERVMDSKGRTVTVAVHILDLRKPSSGGRT